MGNILSFVATKAGTGTSTLARAFAVEAADSLNLLIVDLNDREPASWQWGQRRIANSWDPPVRVETAQLHDLVGKAASVQLCIADAPPSSEVSAEWLARRSILTVVATGCGLDEIDDTIALRQALARSGIADQHLALALCRVDRSANAERARDYLSKKRYSVLQGYIPESRSFHDLQCEGQAVTESPVRYLIPNALELINSVQAAYVAA